MIDKLDMFIALAAERHFGRAAEVCGVTQPSLSSAIRQLEDQLGVQLVYRGSRFQGLTPEGQRVLDWARRISGDMRSMKDEMRSVHAGLSGMLRLGVIPTALAMVADLTAPFTTHHPNLRVTILSRTSAEILAGIDSLELDAGITYLDNEPLGRVAQVPLYTEYYRLLCHKTSSLAGRDQVTWAELASESLCLLTADMQNRRIVNQLLAEAGARVFVAAGCGDCHAGAEFSDRQRHGVLAPSSDPAARIDRVDTPTLLGVYARAPYLHDGRAATLREVLTTHNANDLHGRTSGLSAGELAALEAYLQTL